MRAALLLEILVLVMHHDAEAAARARSLWPAIGAFAVGALLGGVGTARFGDHAVWAATALLAAGLALFRLDDRRRPTRP